MGVNKFMHTGEASPYFRQQLVLGPGIGISFSKFPKRETATAYFSAYLGTNGKSVAAIVKKGDSYSSRATGNGGNPNLAIRWNYCGRNKRPYGPGIMLGVNIEDIRNRRPNSSGGVGAPVMGVTKRAIYLDNIIRFNGIMPGLQIGVSQGLKLTEHAYLRFALYGNIGLRTISYWHYRAFIDHTTYTAVIKSKGDFVNLSVCYGYWHQHK